MTEDSQSEEKKQAENCRRIARRQRIMAENPKFSEEFRQDRLANARKYEKMADRLENSLKKATIVRTNSGFTTPVARSTT